MAHIMKFLINLLLFNRQIFKNLINDVINSYLLKQQNKITIQSNGMLYKIDSYNSYMFDLNNRNLEYLALDGIHDKIFLPKFEHNKYNDCIIKDSTYLLSKKTNNSNNVYYNNEHINKNLNTILKSQELLIKDLQLIITKLETINTDLDSTELDDIKKKLTACTQMLKSNLIKDKNIEDIIDEEVTDCRFKRQDSIEFIDEIGRYLKQIDSFSKQQQPKQQQQTSAYFDLREKFVKKDKNKNKTESVDKALEVENKNNEEKFVEKNRKNESTDLKSDNNEAKSAMKLAKINKTTNENSLEIKRKPIDIYKDTVTQHVNEHEIKQNATKLTDKIKLNGGDILKRIFNDRKMKKLENREENNKNLPQTNKPPTEIVPMSTNAETDEIIPPFEKLKILEMRIQQKIPGENKKRLQLIEQRNDSQLSDLDKEFVKKLDQTMLFERCCDDLVKMLQIYFNQTKRRSSKELVATFNRQEIENICRNINIKDSELKIIIQEYCKNIDLWWQRRCDHQNTCKLLEINDEQFEKSEKEINNKLAVIEKRSNLNSLANVTPIQSAIVQIDPNRNQIKQAVDNLSQQEKRNQEKLPILSDKVKVDTKNVSKAKQIVKVTETENRVKDEVGKEVGINYKKANKQSLSMPNIDAKREKIVNTNSSVNKAANFNKKELVSSSTNTSLNIMQNQTKINTEKVPNVKQVAKITENRVKHEDIKEVGSHKKAHQRSLSVPLNTTNIDAKKEKIENTNKVLNFNKKKLVSSSTNTPYNIMPDQTKINTENVPNVKQVVKATETEKRVQHEDSKEVGTSHKRTHQRSLSVPLNTTNIDAKKEKIDNTNKVLNLNKKKLVSSSTNTPFNIMPDQTKINTENVPNVKQVAKAAETEKRVKHEDIKEVATSHKKAHQRSFSLPPNIRNLDAKKEKIENTNKAVNLNKKELVSSSTNTPFNILPDQTNINVENVPNVKQVVKATETEKPVKHEDSKEVGTNHKRAHQRSLSVPLNAANIDAKKEKFENTNSSLDKAANFKKKGLVSSSTNTSFNVMPDQTKINTENVSNVKQVAKITETANRVKDEEGKEIGVNYKIAKQRTFSRASKETNISTENILNRKSTVKLTETENRVKHEMGEEVGTNYNKIEQQSVSIPSKTVNIDLKNKTFENIDSSVNINENKAENVIDKELVASSINIPFKVIPNQTNINIDNVSNVKQVAKITETENREKNEKGKGIGANYKIADQHSFSISSNTPNIITKNEKIENISNINENKEANFIDKELVSSSINKIPFKITPNQITIENRETDKKSNQQNILTASNEPNVLNTKSTVEITDSENRVKEFGLNEDIENMNNSVNINENKAERFIKKELISPSINIPFKIIPNQLGPQINKETGKISMAKKLGVSRIPVRITATKTNKTDIKKPNSNDKINGDFTKSYSTTAQKEPPKNLQVNFKKQKLPKMKLPLANYLSQNSSTLVIEEKLTPLNVIRSRTHYEKTMQDNKQRETKSAIMRIQNNRKTEETININIDKTKK